MRASSNAHTLPCGTCAACRWRQSSATASNVLTGNTGTPDPKASPCATAQAVRKPVNDPGPMPTTNACTSCKRTSACASKRIVSGIKVADEWLDPGPVYCHTGAAPSVSTAAPSAMLSTSVLVSSARKKEREEEDGCMGKQYKKPVESQQS